LNFRAEDCRALVLARDELRAVLGELRLHCTYRHRRIGQHASAIAAGLGCPVSWLSTGDEPRHIDWSRLPLDRYFVREAEFDSQLTV
jgi:hypothetical protein